MRQAGILAAACIFAVENHFERLKTDHENARILAEILNSCSGIQIDMNSVQTNLVIADFKETGQTASDLTKMLYDNGIAAIEFGPTKIRFVTHLNVNTDEIASTSSILKNIFK